MMDSIPGFFFGRSGIERLFPLCFVLAIALSLRVARPRNRCSEHRDMNHWAQVPYPAVEAHVFGRLSLEKDRARIDFLSDDWVKKRIDAGKLSPQFLPLSGHTFSANTEELRKFAAEHAEDQAAFSETFTLVRNAK
jgi:hypothetical protein